MPRQLFLILLMSSAMIAGASPRSPKLALHRSRTSASDLEVTGMISGLASTDAAYVQREQLLTLPRTSATIADDPDLHGTLHVSGLSFEVLRTALGVLPSSDLIEAHCSDRYRGHLPAAYIARHHPILVLTIDGRTPAAWARQHHQFDPGPYVVMYQHFTPAFKVLNHADQPQLPDQIVRLHFTTEAATFERLAPHGRFAQQSPEAQGFAIARQNCMRCHFKGASGGTKSGRDWQSLAHWANEQPAFFKAYIKDPARFEAHTHMDPNPNYDAATLAALTAYFRTFAGDKD